MQPLNDRLRFITADGRFDRSAIAKGIEACADRISNPALYAPWIWQREFSDFTRMDWLRLATQMTWAKADGEMALYEAGKATRAAGLPTVADQVARIRRPEPSNARAA